MEKYVAEFVGTLVLVLFGTGGVAAAQLKKSHFFGSGGLFITTGWGLAVLLGIIVSGWRSGAHLNPAVTLAVMVSGSLPALDGLGYMAGQLLGAIAGAILLWLVYKKQFDDSENAGRSQVFATGPGVRSYKWNFISELIITVVLIFIIATVAKANPVKGMDSWMVSCLVWGIGISLGGATGYAINPARDLGPRLVYALLPIPHKASPDWGYSWIPVIAPLLGAVIGSLLAMRYIA